MREWDSLARDYWHRKGENTWLMSNYHKTGEEKTQEHSEISELNRKWTKKLTQIKEKKKSITAGFCYHNNWKHLEAASLPLLLNCL